MATTTMGGTNIVELSARRAQRNLRVINEAKHRHPSHVGRMAVANSSEVCRVLQFKS